MKITESKLGLEHITEMFESIDHAICQVSPLSMLKLYSKHGCECEHCLPYFFRMMKKWGVCVHEIKEHADREFGWAKSEDWYQSYFRKEFEGPVQ